MEIKNLSYSYRPQGTQKQLDQVSFTLPTGTITSLIGPNGSGKSTLFNLITRQLKLQTGSITIDNRSITDFTDREYAQQLAAVQQKNPLYDDLSVIDLIRFGRASYHSLFSEESDDSVVNEIMDFLELTALKNISVQQLSGGQQQRVWLAMALAQNPKYLLLDEPTTYLDLHFQFKFLQLIEQLRDQYHLTILMILHDLNQALNFSDRTLLLSKGALAASGEPSKVITPQNLKQYFDINTQLVATTAGQQIVQIP